MAISYKRLGKLLIDREMKKKDLMGLAGISWSTITKMGHDEHVSSDILDCNETALNLSGRVEILPISQFEECCRSQNIRLGIITVGEGSAQTVCDQMIKSGIAAIWNFAPCKLNVSKGVLLQNENLALSLAHLNNQLCNFN